MQETHSSNPPVVTGICDSNKYRARHHRNLKLGSKLKYSTETIFLFFFHLIKNVSIESII